MSVRTVVGALFALTMLVTGCGPAPSKRAQQLFELTTAELDNGHIETALEAAEEAVEVAPRSHFSWWALGLAASESGDLSTAETAYRRAVELTDTPAIRVDLAPALARQGKYEQAVTEYRRVLASGHLESDRETRLELARLLLVTSDWEEADSLAQDVLEADHSSVDARYVIAYSLMGRSELKEAEREVRQVLEVNPDHARARALLAEVLFRQGDLEGATEAAHKAIESNSGLAWPRVTLGRIAEMRGQHKEAVERLSRAVEADPNDARARAHFAQALAAIGRSEEAMSELQQAAALGPEDWFVAEKSAEVFHMQRKIKRAAAEQKRAAELSPEHPERIGSAVHMLIQTGAVDEAVDLLKGLRDRVPNELEPWVSAELAQVLTFSGEEAEARQLLAREPPPQKTPRVRLARASARAYLNEWEKALEEVEQAKAMWAPRGVRSETEAAALAMTGQLDQAIEKARAAIQPNPHARYFDPAPVVLAFALAASGRRAETQKVLNGQQSAIEWEYACIDALFYGGLAYRELGETERANELFRRAIDRWPKHPWSEKMREMVGGEGH